MASSMRTPGITTAFLALLPSIALGAVPVSLSPPPNASEPLLESFVSFSIEFASFPDFAGNSSHPNNFSYNLLTNLGKLQGSNPIIRVGGNTQDYATFNASQEAALIGTFDYSRSRDYPTTISIGPAYFDSYSTWPGLTYIHGFNMGKNGTVGHDTLVGTVPLVCKALDTNKLAYWQLGNEPDLFKTSAQGPVRPAWWNEADYVEEWLNKTRTIRQLVEQNCPEVLSSGRFRFYAPSFAGTSNSLNLITTWTAGLDADNDIAFIDSHNYIGGATQPGVTLQGTLMNHTSTVLSVAKHLNESNILRASGSQLPYILGETNSLYNEGAPGLSNSFGAALWGVDFNLYCAATGIKRVHMHQGTNYRYASWQPVQTVNESLGTKAPYYGNVMVATFLGDLNAGKNVTIGDIELGGEPSIYHSAYAAYVDGRLKRIAVIQMRAYNYTTTDTEQSARPNESFSFHLPSSTGGGEGEEESSSAVKGIRVQRLLANGSDAITGITFDGSSYNYELDAGRPVLLNNVTRGEVLQVDEEGVVTVDVPWSSAAILSLDW
ncbi:hypothetical protein HRR83_001629 [Exophiala dermatitidis]|uniref:Beta-glucuronidase C-terminal domain-containing protein n=2 Tax=Exophiala dermatitidis TaxID=5970 RepID=H6C5V5_EXODN|nr:uncharacterized protein HMPREF1120_07100 [Exophiala dermatitidis NIH/UT8656]KAJ4516300.1 hypothetical protein HRR73_004763 [Exophiala dermatitidis]EHY59101.1 hypothetical protein HMPREF1120_07100 [Exophiala dermatitidis NIH/UT8656]KAJ4523108.1 hypothetical protein HRR75_001507 [Exophiala dermatitidis]KAJ4526435.1 hypothetical protein HRR74_001633 [Exophiala dermatitidis]KAJ4560076.1 hypothetical protein HRR78_000601 [Exophiala dermatitidis]